MFFPDPFAGTVSIEWKYIYMLHGIQVKQGVKFANKLSDRHINYHRLKMKFNIAGQTLSSSMADAIEYLLKTGEKSGDTKFGRCGDDCKIH